MRTYRGFVQWFPDARVCLLAAALLAPHATRAAPNVVANPPAIFAGEIHEGEGEFVRAVFALRNTGDSALHIREVRSGCRCAATEHDSVIPPGGMGRVLVVVDIHGFPDGPFERSVTVISNAANEPRLSLPVRGIVRSFVEITTRYIRIPIGGHGSLVRPTSVRSDRHDLRLVDAVFTADPDRLPPWLPTYPLTLAGVLVPLRHAEREGLTYYELRLWVEHPVRGDIPPGYCLLRVNHPRRREIVCHATIVDLAGKPEWMGGPRK